MTLREQLILVSDAYGAAHDIGRKRVSTIVLNRGATLDAVAEGRADVTTASFERAMRWFSDNWPEAAGWPAGVPRPAVDDGNTADDTPDDDEERAGAGEDAPPGPSSPAGARASRRVPAASLEDMP